MSSNLDAIKQMFGEAVAPNGLPVHENFAKWFGDSKVFDQQGKPLALYHGTRMDFDAFRSQSTGLKLMDGLGSHFGTINAAHDRLRKSFGKETSEQSVMPVYLTIKKYPVKRNGSIMNEVELQAWLAKEAVKVGVRKEKTRAFCSAYPLRSDTFTSLKMALASQGYDGLAYVNSHEDRGSVSYAAFMPAQIKSATGNSGNFDPLSSSLTDVHEVDPDHQVEEDVSAVIRERMRV